MLIQHRYAPSDTPEQKGIVLEQRMSFHSRERILCQSIEEEDIQNPCKPEHI